MFVAPLASEQRERRVIEVELAYFIRSQDEPIHRFLPKDIRYYRRKSNEEQIMLYVHSSIPIIGLPTNCWGNYDGERI